jgi:two-component system, cell cycle response regulator
MKTLIIDDSPDALAVAKARLAKENLDILSAGGGAEGLETARRERPDLILLDLDMPGMSGFDVCRALKADAELCMTPVIFLTGSGCQADKVKGLDLGAVDYVTKPFDGVELQARVRVALRTKHLQDLLVKYAQVDPLTELWNRRALEERLRHEWARVLRYGSSLAFVMVDLDHFKLVNDTYGHPAGDQVLRDVATILAGECRDTDVPARYGGEEFTIVLPSHRVPGAAVLAERCRWKIEDARVHASGAEIRVTASFGVADSDGYASCEEMIEAADKALYRAKQDGRNRVAMASCIKVATT